MKLMRMLAIPTVALILLAPGVAADLLKCVRTTGCEVRLWDPGSQSWGEPEDVPRGTIVDTAWAIGWGEGWNPV